MLSTRTKGVLRWGGIILTMLIYMGWVMATALDYGIMGTYAEVMNDGTMSAEACNSLMNDFDGHFSTLVSVSLAGYLVSTVVILIIFRKVR